MAYIAPKHGISKKINPVPSHWSNGVYGNHTNLQGWQLVYFQNNFRKLHIKFTTIIQCQFLRTPVCSENVVYSLPQKHQYFGLIRSIFYNILWGGATPYPSTVPRDKVFCQSFWVRQSTAIGVGNQLQVSGPSSAKRNRSFR